jgi:hypothetical protein
VGALNNKSVGDYINEYFSSGFQKVGTFRIVNGQKQGGNVACYFCAPDGRVLDIIAGPVNAATLLKEAKWVVEHTEKAMKLSKGDGARFKALFRQWYADRLRQEHGLVVQPVLYDAVKQEPDSNLTYRDPRGQPLAPVLPPPPIDGPDVHFRLAQKAEAHVAGALRVSDRRGRPWVLGNEGRVDMLLSAHALVKIEDIYGAVFEGILGERVSTKPVEIVTPFPWLNQPKPALRK